MESLERYNSRVFKEYAWKEKALRRRTEPRPNGIECPKCKSELYDSFPVVIVASIPSQKQVICLKCNFKGYAFL